MDALSIAARNRRLSQRRRAKNGVKLTVYRGSMGLGPNIGLDILDLSDTGIRMLVRVQLKLKEEIVVELLGVGQGRPIKLPSQIAWSVDAADGVYCVGASFQHRLRYSDLQKLV
jgi:hypothetical protein